jgi:hypothetical protein
MKSSSVKYAIFDRDKKLFSTGGYSPSWVGFPKAKLWKIGPLKNHLNLFKEIPESWEIYFVQVETICDLDPDKMTLIREHKMEKAKREKELSLQRRKEYLQRQIDNAEKMKQELNGYEDR